MELTLARLAALFLTGCVISCWMRGESMLPIIAAISFVIALQLHNLWSCRQLQNVVCVVGEANAGKSVLCEVLRSGVLQQMPPNTGHARCFRWECAHLPPGDGYVSTLLIESLELPHLGFMPMSAEAIATHEAQAEAVLSAADAFILVVDASDEQTFPATRERLARLARASGGRPILVLGNKADRAGQSWLTRHKLARALGLLEPHVRPALMDGPRAFALAACAGKLHGSSQQPTSPLPPLPTEVIRRIYEAVGQCAKEALLDDGQAVSVPIPGGSAPRVLLRMSSAIHLARLQQLCSGPGSAGPMRVRPSSVCTEDSSAVASARGISWWLSAGALLRLTLRAPALWSLRTMSAGRSSSSGGGGVSSLLGSIARVGWLPHPRDLLTLLRREVIDADRRQVAWSFTGVEDASGWQQLAILGCGDAVNSGMLLHWLGSQVGLRRRHGIPTHTYGSEPLREFSGSVTSR